MAVTEAALSMACWRYSDRLVGAKGGAGVVGDGVIGSYVDGLVGRGVVRSAGVERAFRAVRRDLFVERFWVGRDSAYEVGADGWSVEALGLVYADEALITRRDAEGNPTSSASQPSVVAMMLEALDLEPGMRVLEIGAGTGVQRGADGGGGGRPAAGDDD